MAERIQRMLEAGGRFGVGCPPDRPMTCTAPILHGFFIRARLGVVMRQQLWLRFHQIRIIGLQNFCRSRMQIVPPCSQQAAVRRIADKCLLKIVGGFHAHAPAKQQPCVLELSQTILDFVNR